MALMMTVSHCPFNSVNNSPSIDALGSLYAKRYTRDLPRTLLNKYLGFRETQFLAAPRRERGEEERQR